MSHWETTCRITTTRSKRRTVDRARRISLTALFALALLAGASGAGKRENSPKPAMVWPAPPEPARIAFEQSVARPADLGAKVSGFRRFANWVTGDSSGNSPFTKPFGLALDTAGNLCLTDTGTPAVGFYDAKVKRWLRWERIDKLRFQSPVAVVKAGEVIFVADSALVSVIAFDAKGKLRFQIRERLSRPSGLAVSGERLYVADSLLHAVLVFDLKGKYLTQFGRRGVANGEFNSPTHLACDRDGLVYVTDSMNCRIQIFTADGQFKSQIGNIGDSPGHFGRPKGVAVDRHGHVYVMDALFDTLQIFDRDGRFLLNLGAPGQGAGEFWLPNGIAIGSDDRIYVADAYNRRVQVFKYVGSE